MDKNKTLVSEQQKLVKIDIIDGVIGVSRNNFTVF